MFFQSCTKKCYNYSHGTNSDGIASGYSFPDALAASTLASKLKAPIILAGYSVTHSQVSLDYIQEQYANRRNRDNCWWVSSCTNRGRTMVTKDRI